MKNYIKARVIRDKFLAWAKNYSEVRYPTAKEAVNWIQDKY